MVAPKPMNRNDLSAWLRRIALMALGLIGLAALNIAGCPKPTFTQLYPDATAAKVISIHDDTTLDKAGKTSALNALGITDAQVVQVLLDASTPVASGG
jgi:hypothetical protein